LITRVIVRNFVIRSTTPFSVLMTYNPKFGSFAQTPQQRARVLQQMLLVRENLGIKTPVRAHALHQRYVAGELSWQEVCDLLAAPSALPRPEPFGSNYPRRY